MWVKLCAPSRGDHILRLVAPWRLHAMASMELEHWKALGTLEPEPAMAVAVARPWLRPSRGRGRGRAVAVAVAFSQYVLLHPPYLLSTYITVTILGRRCLSQGEFVSLLL